jgi:hypothetical protein
MMSKRMGLRWTIGDVSQSGFEALRLSIWSASNLFGDQAEYAACVNGITLKCAREKAGEVPDCLRWLRSEEFIPQWLDSHVDKEMAEGVAWKLCPIRLFPNLYELTIDNDVILWDIPSTLERWLSSTNSEACLMAEDVQRCLGQFDGLCDSRSINSGIRGLSPGFDLEWRLRQTLLETGCLSEPNLTSKGCRQQRSQRRNSVLSARETFRSVRLSLCTRKRSGDAASIS